MMLTNPDIPNTDSQLQRQNILQSLGSDPGNFTTQCQQLEPFLKENKKETCETILHILVQLTFTQEKACIHWDGIVKHAKKMHRELGRPLGLTTAACDYFSTIQPCLDNPKLIDFAFLEETLKSAHHDFLTGLLSRGAFQQLFEQELSRAKRHKKSTTLIFFDLDKFKDINDTHGHLAGDAILKAVGQVLIRSKRQEDLACRYGGDEFIVLLPETNKFMGLLVGKKIHERINALMIHHQGEEIPVRCSGGLAAFPQDSDKGKGLIECADQALYQAKSRGNHKLCLFFEEKRTFTRIELERTVKIQALPNQDEENFSTSNNISEGGILISSTNKYNIGERLELQIPLHKGSTLAVTGSVVRVEQFDTNLYEIGLSFLILESTAISTEFIADYILQQLA